MKKINVSVYCYPKLRFAFRMNISRSLCKLLRINSRRCSSTENRHFDDHTSKNFRFASTVEKTASLYVHWPYCARRCSYCNFNKYVKKKKGRSQKTDLQLKAKKLARLNMLLKRVNLTAPNCKLRTWRPSIGCTDERLSHQRIGVLDTICRSDTIVQSWNFLQSN